MSKNLLDADDGFTEVRSAVIPRVDLVDKAANGTEFILLKSADDDTSPNLLDASFVESLLKEAGEPDMADKTPDVDPLAKAGDLDVSEPLASPSTEIDATTPGSTAWEQIDADSAMKWAGILSRAKNALELLSGRESQESASGNGSWQDDDNAWNLSDAAMAVDFAISTLAAYGQSEQASVDIDDELEKALQAFPVDALEKVEGYQATIAKAGRVLSTANETELRSAVESILKVLGTLPAVPDDTTIEKKGADVADIATPDGYDETVEKALAEGTEKKADEQPAEKVAKAADTDVSNLTLVYNATGGVLGVVDPTAIQQVDGGAAPAAAADTTVDPNAAAPAAAAPVAKAADEATDTDSDTPLTKSAVESLIQKAVEDAKAAQAEVIDGLEKKVAHLEAPAKSKVFTSGATGTVISRSGETVSGGTGQSTAAELKKASEEAEDPNVKKAIDDERIQRAVAMLGMGRTATAAE